jgi:hypothetical protein
MVRHVSGTLLALGLCTALAASLSAGCKGGETPACPQTVCGGSCVSLQTDPGNCGSCGHACAALEICDLGVCTTGTDGSVEAASDAATDAPAEASTDAPSDSANDAATEAGDAPGG